MCKICMESPQTHACVPCPSGTQHYIFDVPEVCAANIGLEIYTDRLGWEAAEDDCVLIFDFEQRPCSGLVF